jgi:uncharacterized protein YcbK (DUF882 family)
VRFLLLLALAGAPALAEPAPRIACSLDDELDSPSKKAAFLADKASRAEVHAATLPPALGSTRVLTLHNVWTNESLPIAVGETRLGARFDELTRCHYTNQATSMDERLYQAVLKAAARFRASYIEIVSGFRAPKYQLMLRKKGHEVARDSEHPRGHAVDFRIPTVPTRVLLQFVRSLHLGGVGYYPESRFVHADVGRVRFWRGH